MKAVISNPKRQPRFGTRPTKPAVVASILHWPTLLTILISVSGWGFVYLLESLVASPLVEYDMRWETTAAGKMVVVDIENLSRTNRLRKLVVGFASREKQPGQFSNAGMTAIAPAAEGSESTIKIVSDGEEVQFEIMDLQPRRRFQLEALYSGKDNPELRLLNSEGSVYLYKGGMLTWIAKFSLQIVGSLTGAFVILLVLAIFLQPRSES